MPDIGWRRIGVHERRRRDWRRADPVQQRLGRVSAQCAAGHKAGSTGRRPWKSPAIPLSPLIALIAGVLILVMPRLLNYIVAIYLIIVGLLGIFPQLAA